MPMASQQFQIRPATADDEAAVREFLEGLSLDTRWLRYHTGVARVRPWMVDAVVRADHVCHEALLAVQDARIVGIAEWGRIDPADKTADIAVVVRDDCRRHGIARALLRRLGRNGRAHGVDVFTGTILSTNRATVALVHNVAPVRTISFDGPTIDVTVPLRASA